MNTAYRVGCKGELHTPPVCGFAEWANIEGDPEDNSSLTTYVESVVSSGSGWSQELNDLAATSDTGDIIYVDASGALQLLGAGNNGDVLTIVGGLPAYAAPSSIVSSVTLDDLSGVDTDVLAPGDILQYDGTNFINITLSELAGDLVQYIDYGDLNDVTFTSLMSGDVPQWNGSAWVNVPGSSLGGGASSLDDLTDVAISGASSGDILQFNGTNFVNVDTATLAGTIDIADINGVSITTPSNGQILVFNGGVLENQDPSSIVSGSTIGDLSNVDTTGVATGQALIFDGTDFVPGYVVKSNESTRTLYGYITTTGSIDSRSSSGFSCSKSTTGTYVITYTTAFSQSPIAVASPSSLTGTTEPIISRSGSSTTTSVTFYFYDTAASLTDANFNFVIVGKG